MLQNFYETLPEGQKARRLLELQQRAAEQSASIDAKEDAKRAAFEATREENLSASLTKTK
jgi:hypothetical protein